MLKGRGSHTGASWAVTVLCPPPEPGSTDIAFKNVLKVLYQSLCGHVTSYPVTLPVFVVAPEPSIMEPGVGTADGEQQPQGSCHVLPGAKALLTPITLSFSGCSCVTGDSL